MIGPSNKDCLVTSSQPVANLLQLGRKATSDATDFGLEHNCCHKYDDGFCVYFSKYDAESRAELLAVQPLLQ